MQSIRSTLRTQCLVLVSLVMCVPLLQGEWRKMSVPFEPTAISSSGKTLWICGPNASLASSSDGGINWEIRHREANAGVLLSVRWANEKLGFSGGTGGLLMLSTDGGTTWQKIPTSFSDPVLDLSFADAERGIAVTTAAVMYTNDGGKNWQTVLPSTANGPGRFKFVLEVAALDANHAAVLVKEGPAQYYDGRLVTTSDGGATWKTTNIEHTMLNNLLIVAGEYWLVGTEVIDREKRGGRAVAVTFHSHDGINWTRGPKPLIDTNDACRPEGCLMRNGAWFDAFIEGGKVHTFPVIQTLTTQWSAIGTRICALVPDLECAEGAIANTLPERTTAAP